MDEDSVVLYRATTANGYGGTSAIGGGEEQQLSYQPDDILEVYVPASSVSTGGVATAWYRATNRRSGKAGYVQCEYTSHWVTLSYRFCFFFV